MKPKKIKIASFVLQAQRLLDKKETRQAMDMFCKGMNYYSNRILQAINPYSKTDAALVVISLRHIADEIEKSNSVEEIVKGFTACLNFPELKKIEKTEKPNIFYS